MVQLDPILRYHFFSHPTIDVIYNWQFVQASLGNVCLKDIIFKTKLLGLPDFLLLLFSSSSSKFLFEHFFEIYFFFREKLRHTHTAFFNGEIFHYEITQHSHTISRSLVLCLRFISRTISANTSLTFVRCLALASTKEQPHI